MGTSFFVFTYLSRRDRDRELDIKRRPIGTETENLKRDEEQSSITWW
jgi:hypothetical protein